MKECQSSCHRVEVSERTWDWGFAESRLPILSPDASVCPNSAFLNMAGSIYLQILACLLPAYFTHHATTYIHIHIFSQLQCFHSVHPLISSQSCRPFFPPCAGPSVSTKLTLLSIDHSETQISYLHLLLPINSFLH